MYIYIYTNKITGSQYIGQTNNLQKRYNGHKSDSFNPNSKGYDYPFHRAIRKYGMENFTFEILEKNLSIEEANEKEIFWIKEKNTLVSQGGYNITLGGEGYQREKLTWEELKDRGKLFSGEEIEDIQKRLVNNEKYDDIMEFYTPRLSRTFLSNLNNGVNFKNPNLKYPLKTDFSGEGRFSKEEIIQIKEEIKAGVPYSKIQEKHNIKSAGFLSMVNSGKYYFDKNETYPLCLKGCADKSWIKDCIYEILYSTKSLSSIAKKFGKADSTIKKLGQGRANKQDKLIYPLRSNLEQNKKIFEEFFK